jgi:hypothetical protein
LPGNFGETPPENGRAERSALGENMSSALTPAQLSRAKELVGHDEGSHDFYPDGEMVAGENAAMDQVVAALPDDSKVESDYLRFQNLGMTTEAHFKADAYLLDVGGREIYVLSYTDAEMNGWVRLYDLNGELITYAVDDWDGVNPEWNDPEYSEEI